MRISRGNTLIEKSGESVFGHYWNAYEFDGERWHGHGCVHTPQALALLAGTPIQECMTITAFVPSGSLAAAEQFRPIPRQ